MGKVCLSTLHKKTVLRVHNAHEARHVTHVDNKSHYKQQLKRENGQFILEARDLLRGSSVTHPHSTHCAQGVGLELLKGLTSKEGCKLGVKKLTKTQTHI
jgi:hypothetical protein